MPVPLTRKGLQEDFASVQGNHAILAIPVKNDLIWLECTSQIHPFGFQGNFTDGRQVLLIKPDGGEIVKTKSFLEKDNSQLTNGNYVIGPDGSLSGKMSIVSKGSQYDHIFTKERLSETDKEAFYKNYFGNINNLKLEKISFKNNADDVTFTQDIQISAAGYAANSGGRMMFVLDAFNVNGNTPKKYRTRENPFEVSRGYYDYDEITINLPEGYDIEALPSNFESKNKFGEYSTQIVKNQDNTLLYKRSLLIKDGYYDNKEYEDYRLFREQIARNDNAKIVLTKKKLKL
ncbi:DUF3858 domain-containing protein [Flavobacterium sp. 3HN19-14]|uniref:DUF3858 domain-containing protein n=1 Tax=Flavobacterium sp. 3HN19-14 TaxID=3448133 RepID=UPI003EE346F3